MNYRNILSLLGAFAIIFLVRYFYFKPKFVQGQEFHQINATLSNGESFALKNLKGKYVLVDFWGSWCGPCRKENPKLVSIYQKFHDKEFKESNGFEVVSIGLENSENSWKKAIEKDGLSWKYHILQTEGLDSPIAQNFGVKEIPTKYLLDHEGKVIKVNGSVEEIDRFLEGNLVR